MAFRWLSPITISFSKYLLGYYHVPYNVLDIENARVDEKSCHSQAGYIQSMVYECNVPTSSLSKLCSSFQLHLPLSLTMAVRCKAFCPTWVLKGLQDVSSFGQWSLKTGSGEASGKKLSPGITGEILAFGEPWSFCRNYRSTWLWNSY